VQRLVGSKSGKSIQVEQHVCPLTVVSVSDHYKNPTTSKHVGLEQTGHHHHHFIKI